MKRKRTSLPLEAMLCSLVASVSAHSGNDDLTPGTTSDTMGTASGSMGTA